MPKSNPFQDAINARKQEKQSEIKPPDDPPITEEAIAPALVITETETSTKKKRGRPAIGKRSDDEWIGRTFYIKRETDLDVEELLVRLRRQGIEIDKSELVERLLTAWVKWQQGENLEIQFGDISPIQK